MYRDEGAAMVDFDWSTFREFVNEFRDESDRAAVLLGAAKLDQILFQLLQRRLLPSTTGRDSLLDGDSALGTFSARINACHRLGLIDGEYARALHLIRRIRNVFAHEVSGCSIRTGGHRDRVRDLEAPFRPYPQYAIFRKHFFEGLEGPEYTFRAVLALIVGRLEIALERVIPISESSTEPAPMISRTWREALKQIERDESER